MSRAKWEIHRDILSIPSAIGACLLAIYPLNKWWMSFPLLLVFLLVFQPVYAAVFGESDNPGRRLNWQRNTLVVLAQIIFWSLLVWFFS